MSGNPRRSRKGSFTPDPARRGTARYGTAPRIAGSQHRMRCRNALRRTAAARRRDAP